MSILDDAIREHLELKRAHGADEAEVKKLEDEAFGPPQRPDEIDPLAEAPTEFLTAPEEVVEQAAAEVEEARRAPDIADLQEGPHEAPYEPAIEEDPAAEHEIVAEPPAPEPDSASDPGPDGVHTTEEREAIADQPTQMFDVQAEIDAGAEPEAEEPAAFDDEDDFFSEQRLSDELNQALEAPVTEEEPLPAPPEPLRAPEPPGEEPPSEEPADQGTYEPETGSHDDVLEDTPEFLEDTEDDVWFEQRPPKDFDFDD